MPRSASSLPQAYDALRIVAASDLKAPAVGEALIEVAKIALRFLGGCQRTDLKCDIPGKDYFCFQQAPARSRPINSQLFDAELALQNIEQVFHKHPAQIRQDILQATLYTAAIAYCAVTDLTKTGDQKTPGTYFEIFVGHFVARVYGVNPKNRIQVLNLDLQSELPTDFIFDLGPDKARIHLPIKTSTRERVIQVWAHQRVLDGVYGMGRFRGVLVCLAETNAKPDFGVTEVCLPNQWAIYQMFIAQMHRVYYLDVPLKYAELGKQFPFIPVIRLSNSC